MRPLAVIVSILVGIGAVAATIWVGRYSSLADPRERTPMRWETGTGEAQMRMREQKEAELMKKESQNGALKKAIDEENAKVDALAAKKPEIATKAPFPKAVMPPKVYDFGSMGVNEERKHKFTIENKGEGPL